MELTDEQRDRVIRWSPVQLVMAVATTLTVAAAVTFAGANWVVRLALGVTIGAAAATEVVVPGLRAGFGRTPRVFWHHVAEELDRARQHDRVVTLVRCQRSGDVEAIVEELTRRHLRAGEGACHVRGSVFIVLPETERDAATAALTRYGVEAGDAVFAQFPEDGLTVEALQQVLRRRVVESTHADARN